MKILHAIKKWINIAINPIAADPVDTNDQTVLLIVTIVIKN